MTSAPAEALEPTEALEPADHPIPAAAEGVPVGSLAAQRVDVFVAVGVGLVAFAAFALHLLPGVGFWDTAIFQAAAPTLGLTHPTGYPTFLLLGWAFTSLVPLGDAAFRMNLLTAILGGIAIAGLYALVRRLGVGRFLAVSAALAFAFLQTFWRTAVRADPHVLHAAFAVGLLLLVLEWRRRGGDLRWLAAAAFVFGLAIGNHLLTALLAPALAAFVLLTEPRILRRPRSIAAVGMAGLAGAAVYLYVPIRAAADPPIHHDFAPTTWNLFWRYVLGGDFQGSMGFLSLSGPGRALAQLPSFVDSLARASNPAVVVGLVVLAAIGLLALLRRDPAAGVLLALGGGLTLYAALTYSNGDIERYYFVPVLVGIAFAAVGLEAVLAAGSSRLPTLADAAPVALVVPVFLAATNAARVDAASAGCFADTALGEVAPNAVIMSWWSYTTPLWYERFVAGRRPDVEVFNGIDRVPAELDRRFGQGRPIYLIQMAGTLDEIRARYALRPIDACGVTLEEVTARVPAA